MERDIEWKEPGVWEFTTIESVIRVMFKGNTQLNCQAKTPKSKPCKNHLGSERVSSLRTLLSGLSTLQAPSSELIALLPDLSELAICTPQKHNPTLSYESQLQHVRKQWLQNIHDACANTYPPQLPTPHQPALEETASQCSSISELSHQYSERSSQIFPAQGPREMVGSEPALTLPIRQAAVQSHRQQCKPGVSNNDELASSSTEQVHLRPNLQRHDAMSPAITQKDQVDVDELGHMSQKAASLEDSSALDASSPESETSDVFSPTDMLSPSSPATGISTFSGESVWDFDATPSRGSGPSLRPRRYVDYVEPAEASDDDDDDDDDDDASDLGMPLKGPFQRVERYMWPRSKAGTLSLDSENFEPKALLRVQTLPKKTCIHEDFAIERPWVQRRHSFHSLTVHRSSDEEKFVEISKTQLLRRRDSFSARDVHAQVSCDDPSSDAEYQTFDEEDNTDLTSGAKIGAEINDDIKASFTAYRKQGVNPIKSLESLLDKMRHFLKGEKSLKGGYIYCYSREGAEGYVKIGSTVSEADIDLLKGELSRSPKAVDGRLRAWSGCGYHPQLLFFKHCPQAVARMETLVHITLAQHQRIASCSVCTTRANNPLKKGHIEWFNVNESVARDTVELWQRFSRLSPYEQPSGNLQSKWSQKAKDKSADISKNRRKEWTFNRAQQELETWVDSMKEWTSEVLRDETPGVCTESKA